MRAASSGRPSARAARIAVDEKSPCVVADERRDGDAEAEAAAERGEHRGVAGPALAEAEVGADDDVAHAEAVGRGRRATKASGSRPASAASKGSS